MTGKHAAVSSVEDQPGPSLVLSENLYEWLRAMVEVIFPGISALYLALTPIWNLPGSEKVTGTIAAVTVFLGLFVRLARRTWNNSDAKYDGQLKVDTTETGDTTLQLDLDHTAEELSDQSDVTLKVNPE